MKLRHLIEVELGKDPEHEKIIKGREETLLKKIKRKQSEKRTTLKGYENKVRYDTKKAAELNRIDALKKSGVLEELHNFNNFVEEKIKEYIADKKQVPIKSSDAAVKTMTDLFLQRTNVKISKNKQKMIIDLIETLKNKGTLDPKTEKGIEVIQGMLLIPEPELHQRFRNIVGKQFADLDLDDIESFINNLSKDSEVKSKISNINKSLTRLSDLLATTKHLSQVGSGKTVRIPPHR